MCWGFFPLPSLKFRANFPFCSHSPCPNPSAPDWQGNPIPTLPAEKCLLLQQSQQKPTAKHRLLHNKSLTLSIFFFFSLLSPFPAAVRLHSLADPRLIINLPWLESLHKEHTPPAMKHHPPHTLLFLGFKGKEKLLHLKKD